MRYVTLKFSLYLTILPTTSLLAAPASYQTYEVDRSPFSRYPAQEEELRQIKSRLKHSNDREADLKRQLEIIASIEEEESGWIDGHWMVAEKAFELGSFYTKEADLSYARSVFLRGSRAAERCLKQQKNNPICKLLLGAMLGKMGSIDGIFTSLSQAKHVEQLWLDVIASPYDHRFTETTTVQGAARYALGMFYRLVPNIAIFRWLFGVQGDMEKSIRLHRETLAIDSPNPCNKVMLAVSLICSGKGDAKSPLVKEGLQHLEDVKSLRPDNAVAKVCWDAVPRLSSDLSASCGYETSRQQKQEDEEKGK